MPATPLYQRIAAELRDTIASGQLPPGSQLPTEQELGERYQVSRNTVRLALGLLANEGIITSTLRRRAPPAGPRTNPGLRDPDRPRPPGRGRAARGRRGRRDRPAPPRPLR